MSNPTREEIIEALKKLEHAAYYGGEDWYSELWRSKVIKVIPPVPQPTMAEVEWDDDKHFLAEAEQCKYGKVIMLGLDETGFIEFFIPRLGENRYGRVHPDTLTPTGKRYTPTEVQE